MFAMRRCTGRAAARLGQLAGDWPAVPPRDWAATGRRLAARLGRLGRLAGDWPARRACPPPAPRAVRLGGERGPASRFPAEGAVMTK